MGSGHQKTSSPAPFQSNCLSFVVLWSLFLIQIDLPYSKNPLPFVFFPSLLCFLFLVQLCTFRDSFSSLLSPSSQCYTFVTALQFKARLEPTAIKLNARFVFLFLPPLASTLPVSLCSLRRCDAFSPPVFTSDNVRGVALGV